MSLMMTKADLKRTVRWLGGMKRSFKHAHRAFREKGVHSERSLQSLANWIVMGWLGDGPIEQGDAIEEEAKSLFQSTVKTLAWQYPDVAEKVLAVLKDENGTIITPEHKSTVLWDVKKLLIQNDSL